MSTSHDLKIWPEHYDATKSGDKPFTVRINDRNFNVGHELVLRKWNPDTHAYEDALPLRFHVTHVLRGSAFGLKRGWVIMGLSRPVASTYHNGNVSEEKIQSVAFAAAHSVCDAGDVNSRKHNTAVIAEAIREALT